MYSSNKRKIKWRKIFEVDSTWYFIVLVYIDYSDHICLPIYWMSKSTCTHKDITFFFFNHKFIIGWNMFCYLYRFHLNPSLNHVHTKLILKYFKNCENFTMNFYILINSIYIKSSKQLSFSVRWINLQQPNRPSQKFQIKKLTWHAMKKSPVNFMIFLYYIYFKLS